MKRDDDFPPFVSIDLLGLCTWVAVIYTHLTQQNPTLSCKSTGDIFYLLSVLTGVKNVVGSVDLRRKNY